MARHFIDDVYTFADEHQEYGVYSYNDILFENRIEWDNVSMSKVDTSSAVPLHSDLFANVANNTITKMAFNVWQTFLCWRPSSMYSIQSNNFCIYQRPFSFNFISKRACSHFIYSCVCRVSYCPWQLLSYL